MQCEFKFALDVTDETFFCVFGVKEEVSSGVCNLKVGKPPIEKFSNGTLFVKHLILFFIVSDILDGLEDIISVLDKVLLQSHALRQDVALLSLLAARNLFLNLFVVLNALLLSCYEVTACTHSIHKFRLEEVIEGVQVKALVEQLQVHLLGQTHQTHSLILHLSHQCFVRLALGGNQLGYKIFAVRFGDSLRLRIKDIC